MALKGLDIFKLSPKTNCKECGVPTCMAFCMKVAQGALPIEKCPHMSAEALALLSDQTAPPMKTIELGQYKLGGETVLFRHDKTFVSHTLYANYVCDAMPVEVQDSRIAGVNKVDYERIGEHMYVEGLYVNHAPEAPHVTPEGYLELVEKAKGTGKALVLHVEDTELAEKAAAIVKGLPVVLNGANAENYEAMSKIAADNGFVLGVVCDDLSETYDTIGKLEALGNKNLIIDVGVKSIKDAFEKAVKIRRAAIKNNDRPFGYPTLVCLSRICRGDEHMQAALASLFTARYGSIVAMDEMNYAKALPLYGLRQNLFTDPQKPMKVEPAIYPLNGADENAICAVTVDFALTYFVVSGEMERSNVPVNLIISDAGGYSVLTAWAAGKFSASSIAKSIEELGVAEKIKCQAPDPRQGGRLKGRAGSQASRLGDHRGPE